MITKYFMAIIKIEAKSENEIEEVSNNLEDWIDSTLDRDNKTCSENINTNLMYWGETKVDD